MEEDYYTNEDLEWIEADTKMSKKEKIDALLQIAAFDRTNLGTDSTKIEVDEVKKRNRRICRIINKLDPVIGAPLMINTKDHYEE